MKKLTKGGIALLTVGIILVVIGLGLFFSVFFAGIRQVDQFQAQPFPQQQRVPFERAVIGVIMVGLGAFLGKVGLGMGIVGSSKNIARWAGQLFDEGKKASQKSEETGDKHCTSCGFSLSSTARFCSNCGKEQP